MKNHKLNILGRKIKVEIKKIDDRYNGLYHDTEGLIELHKDLGRDKLNQVYCHEIIHSVIFRSGIDQTSLSYDLHEIICEQISKVLCENFTLKLKHPRQKKN